MSTSSVLVIGGGIAGLAAALELARSGVDVTLLESSDRLGGKIDTRRIDGFQVETGPDSFVAYRPAALELGRSLGLGDQVIGTLDPRLVHLRRSTRAGSAGRMVAMPDGMGLVLPTRLGPFVRTKLFSWPEKLRAALDVVLPRRLGPRDAPIGELLRHRLGPGVVRSLADPLLGGVYGASVDELSLDAVVPQLRQYETQHRSLMLASLAQGRAARKAARKAAQKAGQPAASGSPFRTFRDGLGSLVDAVAAALEAEPTATVRLCTEVTALTTVGERSVATLADGTTLEADAVVIAAPGPVAAGLVEPTLPEAARLIRTVRHASSAVVTLGYDVDAFPTPLAGHGFLEAGPVKAVFSGCTFTSLKWAGRAPDGKVLLRVFLPDRSSSLIGQSDDAVLDAVVAEVATVLGATKAPTTTCVTRRLGAMPVYSVGHLERMDALDAAMAAAPNWVLAGCTYRGVGVPDCISSGKKAATVAMSRFPMRLIP